MRRSFLRVFHARGKPGFFPCLNSPNRASGSLHRKRQRERLWESTRLLRRRKNRDAGKKEAVPASSASKSTRSDNGRLISLQRCNTSISGRLASILNAHCTATHFICRRLKKKCKAMRWAGVPAWIDANWEKTASLFQQTAHSTHAFSWQDSRNTRLALSAQA